MTGTPRDIFLDTNVYLHFQSLVQLPWAEIVGTPDVRVHVPLLLLEELDKRKNQGEPVLSERAAGAIRMLEGAVRTSGGRVNEHISVVLLRDPVRHVRRSNNDDEMLSLLEVLNPPPTLISADAGMRLRAEERLPVVALADRYRLPAPDRAAREIAELRRQLADAKGLGKAEPRVVLADGQTRLRVQLGQAIALEDFVRAEVDEAALDVQGQGRSASDRPASEDTSIGALWDKLQAMEVASKFGARREAWLAEVDLWARECWTLLAPVAQGLSLNLRLVNDGKLPARGVEVTLSLPEDQPLIFIAGEDDPDVPDRPAEPSVGGDDTGYTFSSKLFASQSRSIASPPVPVWHPTDWDLRGQTATCSNLTIRQGGKLQDLLQPLKVIRTDTSPIDFNFTLHWRLIGEDPALDVDGDLHFLTSVG